jgi:hypothetical protein
LTTHHLRHNGDDLRLSDIRDGTLCDGVGLNELENGRLTEALVCRSLRNTEHGHR